MSKDRLSIIVVGGLNTDIIAMGAKKLLKAGEHTYASELKIGPGGKSRNIAQMIAILLGKNKIAMIGKTSKDPYGLWKLPLTSLRKAGVNTDFVNVTSFKESKQFPGIALIPVDTQGRNQIYVLPGITNNFLPKDIDGADGLFKSIANNNGFLVISLELPLQTAIHAIKKANKFGIKVFLDPGGIDETKNYDELLKQDIYFIKPNEHEAKILTGVKVKDFATAKDAASKLLGRGIENVLITFGKNGGYLFNKELSMHIPTPPVNLGKDRDETGCGDQTMAALVAFVSTGSNILNSAKAGILAGTLQFQKAGISPVTKSEINKYL